MKSCVLRSMVVLVACLAFHAANSLVAQEPVLRDPAFRDVKVPDDFLATSKAVLSPLDGEQKLSGLQKPVEVLRDRWGVAHIYAQNTPDLFFAQGYLAASDRLFQIDWWRRQATGTMAEVFGPNFLAGDRFARRMKYRGDMEKEWSSYSPDTREIAESFTRGINAAIDRFGDRLPIEFQILGYKPAKWKPEDILGRASGIYMSQNFRNELQRAQLIAILGLEKVRKLAPVDPARDYVSPLAIEELKAIDKNILAEYEAATRTLSFTPPKTESNNWVIAGNRSKSGKPLLASDPHRAIALPSLRYLVHLHAPGWNVIGSGEPGLPGVAIGHNEHIAWGFTIIGTDQTDFYVEETHPEHPDQYKVGDRWEKMTVVQETFAVKGAKDHTAELRFTRHGPVLHQDAKRHRAYALKWVGSEPGGAAYLASLAVDRTKNRNEFLAALDRWKIPGLNFVYADVEGNIGWVAAARTPLRPKHDGLLPVPGNGYEWNGFLKVEELPQRFNPKDGQLITANHNIIPEGYRAQIGYEFAPPYRYQRLRELLSKKDQWELAEFRALQHDSGSIPGKKLAAILKGITLEEAELEPHRKQMMEWDGSLSVDSPMGSLYAIWVKYLYYHLAAIHVEQKSHEMLLSLSGVPTLLRAMETADPVWFGNDAVKVRDGIVRKSFSQAVELWKALPPEQQKRWGALHTVTFNHPLATLDAKLAKAFNIGPFERSGDGSTPNNTRYNTQFQQIHGATYRHLIDLADWDRTLATSGPGQSGQPTSPHYADLAPLWAKGEYFPLMYSRKKVEEVTANRMKLVP